MKQNVVICAIMMMLFFGMIVSAEKYQNLTYTISNGEVIITGCDQTATSVRIPNKIDGALVVEIGDLAFGDCDKLTMVEIPRNVTKIGNNAFDCCTSLETVYLPDGLLQIGTQAFSMCKSLKNIELPKSLTTIGREAFDLCKSLEKITIPKNVTSIGRQLFVGCTVLKTVTFEKDSQLITFGHTPFEKEYIVEVINVLPILKRNRNVFEKYDGHTILYDFKTLDAALVRNDMVETYIENGWKKEKVIEMYSLDGKTKEVSIYDEKEDFEGLYEYPVCNIYSLNGSTKVVKKADVEKYLNDEWYSVPSTKMYSADGEEKVFANEEVEKAKKNGWHTEAVCTLYKEGKAPLVVGMNEKEKYVDDGWSDAVLYATDGRSIYTDNKLAEMYIKLGWYREYNDAYTAKEPTCGSVVTKPVVESNFPINVMVDGEVLDFEVKPVIINGSTMVPLRAIFEKLDAVVDWNGVSKTVAAKRNDTTILLPIYGKLMIVNDKVVELNEAATIISGSTLVPVRAISEALGCKVAWDGKEKLVSIVEDTVNNVFMYGQGGRTRSFKKNEVCLQVENGWYFDEALTKNLIHGDVSAESCCRVCGQDVTKVYSPKGENRYILNSQMSEYRDAGWSDNEDEIYTVMYAADGRSKRVLKKDVEANKAVGWYVDKMDVTTTMYTLQGKTITIWKAEIEEYKNKGWYSEPVVELYNEFGESKIFKASEKDMYLSEGWFAKKDDANVTMYAPDGRTKSVLKGNVEKEKAVGWYMYPVITVYDIYGNSKVIDKATSEEHEKQGWYSNKDVLYVTMYAPDGRTKSVLKGKVAEEEKVGWSTQKPDLRYDDSKLGSVVGNVTWQYNDMIGTKPDVGADVFLIQTNHIPTNDDKINIMLNNTGHDTTIQHAEVDGMGNYYFDYVPAGEYYIMIVGKNANMSPDMQSLEISIMKNYLTGKLSKDAIEFIELKIKLYSFSIERITVVEGRVTRHSKDWGHTYI